MQRSAALGQLASNVSRRAIRAKLTASAAVAGEQAAAVFGFALYWSINRRTYVSMSWPRARKIDKMVGGMRSRNARMGLRYPTPGYAGT